MRFITLSAVSKGEGSYGVTVNTENIETAVTIASGTEDEMTRVVFVSGQIWHVQETLNEIRRLAQQEL